MTRVEGKVRRDKLNSEVFVDIIGSGVQLVAITRDYLEFDGDLSPEQIDAIWARMESKDDADQERRAALRADVAELEDGPLRRAICYMLGDE